jgi:MFS family permease
MLLTATLLGVGIGLALAALGNLIVEAVQPTETGVASWMNTVMRTLGGAVGGQLSATFTAHNIRGTDFPPSPASPTRTSWRRCSWLCARSLA